MGSLVVYLITDTNDVQKKCVGERKIIEETMDNFTGAIYVLETHASSEVFKRRFG